MRGCPLPCAFGAEPQVLLDEDLDLLRVHRAVAVNDADRVDGRPGQLFEHLVDFLLLDGRDGHQVGRHFVALVEGVADHSTASEASLARRPRGSVEHAVLLRQHVGPPVGLSGVDHGGQLQLRRVVADDPAQVASSQNFQAPKLSRAKTPLAAL